MHAHSNIYFHMKMLFNLIIKHVHVPVDFELRVMAPVMKDKRKDTEDVRNNRPFATLFVLAKRFDMCWYTKLVVV